MLSLRANSKRVIILLIFASLLLNFSSTRLSRAATTTMQVDPSVNNANVGDSFNVNITITQVTNLTGWEFKLFYLRGLLNCSAIAEGPFLKTGGSTTRVFNITNNYNSTHGRVLAGCALLGMNVSVNGTGTAATLAFKALAGGDSPLDLVDTKLSDEKIPPLPIAHIAIDGVVHIAGAPPIHDVAVINVTTSKDGCKPMPTVSGDSFAKVNVTVLNIGDFTETDINVTVYANTTSVASQNVTLSSGNSTTITFTWNTTGFAYGNYTTSAYAWPVPGETNTANNNLTGATVEVTIPGDVNGDGTVNILDAIQVSNSFLATPDSSNWNPNADINSDNVVNILDAIILANHFLQHYP